MWLKGGDRRRETGEMGAEIVGDRPGAALWAVEDCWEDFIPSGHLCRRAGCSGNSN